MGKELHPKVKEFKEFINKHPALIAEIRKSGRSWQYYYEKWVLNGENDPMWKSYTNDETNKFNKVKQSKLFGQLLQMTQNIDINKVQQQVEKLDSTIGTIQEMLNQFLEYQNDQGKDSPPNHFNWFRD